MYVLSLSRSLAIVIVALSLCVHVGCGCGYGRYINGDGYTETKSKTCKTEARGYIVTTYLQA